jgi:precorrin-6B methylase 2
MSKAEAGTDNLSDALYYASSAFIPELHKALRYFSFEPSDAILDYGSGKGGVMAQMSKYPFGRIAGIELSQTLVDISKANFKKLRLNRLEIIHGDATTFIDIDEFNYFYFCNPFQGHVFERVIDNIIASVDKNPRLIAVIYYHPKCHDLIDKTGRFKLTKVFQDGARRLNIYLNQ